MTTEVLFKKYGLKGEVIAFFPYIIETTDYQCLCYAHVGQHFHADHNYARYYCSPCTEEEYKPLLNELISLGYKDLKVIKRMSWNKISKACSDFNKGVYHE